MNLLTSSTCPKRSRSSPRLAYTGRPGQGQDAASTRPIPSVAAGLRKGGGDPMVYKASDGETSEDNERVKYDDFMATILARCF